MDVGTARKITKAVENTEKALNNLGYQISYSKLEGDYLYFIAKKNLPPGTWVPLFWKVDFNTGSGEMVTEKSMPNDMQPGKIEIQVEDSVNHPSHYETGKYECIDVMLETQGVDAVKDFCICNAFKYLYRHNNKNGSEDISKAHWYLTKYLELEKACKKD